MGAPQRLANLLVTSRLVSEEAARRALREAEAKGASLIATLVRTAGVSDLAIRDAIAAATGAPRFELGTIAPDASLTRLATAEWCFQSGVVPLYVDPRRMLVVAATDPGEVGPFDDLSFRAGLRVQPMVAAESELNALVRFLYFGEPLRPSAPPPVAAGPLELERGMAAQMDALHQSSPRRSAAPEPRPSAPPSGADPLLFALQRLARQQESAAIELQALFELCADKGLFSRPEYLTLLRARPDD